MSSALYADLDLQTVDADAVEQSMQSGGLPPEGLHHAVLAGCREVQANSGSVGRELVFRILAGPGSGLEVKEALWISSDPKAKNRRVLFMHRLGLLKKVQNGDKHIYVPIEGISDFTHRLGAECVVDLKHVEEEWEDKKGQKRKTMKAQLSWEGVLPLDDKRCKDVKRAAAGAAKQAIAATPPAAKKDDFSDL